MKTAFSSAGLITITAETKEENVALFQMVNEQNFTPTGKPKTTYKKASEAEPKTRKTKPKHECPVIGCDSMIKSDSLHLRQRHGVDIHTKEIHETFKHAIVGVMDVAEPVVLLPTGEYKLRKMGGLLA